MTTFYCSKIRVRLVEGSLFDAGKVDIMLKSNYRISYTGFYRHEPTRRTFLYIQCKTRMSSNIVKRLLQDTELLKIEEMDRFEEVDEGLDLLQAKGELKKPGGARGRRRNTVRAAPMTVTNDTSHASTTKTVVTVNSFGQESLEHITKEYILNLLAHDLGWDVLCEFAYELYRFEKNMNFCLRIKDRYIKTRLGEDGAWVTSLKKSEYERMLLNLVEKNLEAVDTFRDDVPENDLKHFEDTMIEIENRRRSKQGSDERDEYDVFARDGVNIIGENIWEASKRKKLKLV